jgi:5S rRNA maturation endonuclease (ribonuclease M5)
VLYHLSAVKQAISKGETVYVAEGEKDVETLVSYGLTATTTPGGAGTWREIDTAALCGAQIVIFPDNDSPGVKHAKQIAKELHKHAASVKVVQLPGLPEKGDVSDWMEDASHSSAELKAAVSSVSPWMPTVHFKGHSLSELRNLPQREWLVEGLLAKGESAMIRGPSGSGKTFVAIDLIRSLLTQQPWMDEHTINPTGERSLTVAYSTNEGTRALADRFESALGGQIDAPGLQIFTDVPQLFDRMGDSGVLRFMDDYLAQYDTTPDVLVIDTLSAGTVGAEENSAKDMNVVMDAVKQIQAAWDCSVILLHHDGKHTGQERGSTVLRASMDLVLAVSENSDADPRSVRIDKCKDGPGGDVFAFQLTEVGPSVVVRWSGRWDACEATQSAASTHTREIISLVQEQKRLQVKDVAVELGITDRIASRSLEQLTGIGILVRTKGAPSQNGGRPPWIYSIVSEVGKCTV